ncbi:MAG: hypothetical protein HY290_12615 [Planctomycetia bacterium]|nr:hypothetical protein [Planctomycetia bacterium]
MLADRPLTILDPHVGRTHLFLADPERFNLNPINLAPASSILSPAGANPGGVPQPAGPGTEK